MTIATVAEWLQRSVAAGPHDAAIVDVNGSETSYSALADEITALCARLRAAGIGAGDVVVVLLPQGPRLLKALLAVMSVAAAFPVNPADRNLERLLGEISVKAILTDGTLDSAAHAVAERLGLTVISIDGPAVSAPEAGKTRIPVADDAAILVATSGTTAAPKIVSVSHASLAVSLAHMVSWTGLTRHDRSLCLMPLTHLHGLLRSALPVLYAGGAVIASPGFDEASVFGWIEALRPTYLTASPGLFRALLQRPARDVRSLRLLLTGSDSIDPGTSERIAERFSAPLMHFYALSEVAPVVAATIAAAASPPGAVGRAQAPWSVKLVAADGADSSPDREGEIAIKGGIFNPLVGRNAPAQRMTEDGYLLTGDLGRLDGDGNLFVLGRVDDRIHRGAEKIDPRAVEEALLAVPNVRQAAVFGFSDPVLGQRVGAAIVPAAGATLREADVQRAVAERLFSYMVPERIVFVADLPANAAGKIARSRMAEALGIASFAAPSAEPSSAEDDIDEKIAALFERRLSITSVDRQARFFDLGGDSFGAVELLFEVEDLFGVNVPPATFIANNSVAALARLVRESRDERPVLKLVPLNAAGGLPPLFIPYPPEGYVAFAGLMAEALGPEQPIYSFNAPRGADGPAQPESMEEKAAKMIALIRAVQPKGPYYLAGYSFGAHAAFEIAQQFVAAGNAVAFVGIIDDQADLQLRRFAVEQVPIVPLTTLNCNHWALRRYVPKPYPGRVTLFRAAGGYLDYMTDPSGGWGDLALGGVEIHDIDGDHETIIRTEGFKWGPVLSSALAKARRAASIDTRKKSRKVRNAVVQSAMPHLVEARTASKRGDVKTEIAEYRRAAAVGPLPVWAMRNLSHALVDSGAIEPGLAFMEEAAAADPWPLNLLLDLAEMKVKSKRAQGLDQLCDQARAIVPEDSDALFDFGRLCGIVGRLDEAESAMRRSLALDLKRAYSHQGRGEKYSYLSEILARDGRFEEAIAAGRQAVDDNPRSAAYAARLGVLYARAKRNGEAADWYRRALMLDPGNVENTAKLNGLLRLV